VNAKKSFLFGEFDFLCLFVEGEFACFYFELHGKYYNLNRIYRDKNILNMHQCPVPTTQIRLTRSKY
jgi:hypothetical protein